MRSLFQTFKKINVKKTFFSPNKEPTLKYSNLLKTFSPPQNNLRYSEKGISNFYIQELKKAKYQGFFDPGSYAKKNIFIDNSILINDSQISQTKKDYLFKSPELSYKKLLIENGDKNLLISESESKYPLITYKRRINERPIKSPYDYYIENKFDCSENKSIKNIINNKSMIELGKDSQNIHLLKNNNNTNFRKICNNSSIFSDKNKNIDFNDCNKYVAFGNSVNLYDNEKEFPVDNNSSKLIDNYLNKLLKLFIEHMNIYLKKITLKEFYKIIQKHIENKEKNISKNKKHKYTNKEIHNQSVSNISLSICNSYKKNKSNDFKKYTNNSNIISKNKNINHYDNIQKKYDFGNLNFTINKNKNKTKKVFRKKSAYSSKVNTMKVNINRNSINKNHDENLECRMNPYNFTFQNDSPIQSPSIVMKKKPEKYQFSLKKKQYNISNNCLLKNNNLKTNLQKTIFKKESKISNNINIKLQKIYSYISSDNLIYITIKNYIDTSKINCNKKKHKKLGYFGKNLLEIIKNDNFYYLFKGKINTDNLNNSEKINKGILLLQSLINKNYEEKLNTSDNSVESQLVNNFSRKEQKEKNNSNNSINEEQTKTKNNINSKLTKIITFIENKKNQDLLKFYFTNFRSLLNNKIKKQIIVRKIEVVRKIQKTVLSTEIKNRQTVLGNNSVEKSDNSKSKYLSGFSSPLNYDKTNNVDSFNGNIRKADNNNIKLKNGSNDYSFISVSLASKFNPRNVNESMKNKDESFYECYYKYQDFIFTFRTKLIFYFLSKKNSGKD